MTDNAADQIHRTQAELETLGIKNAESAYRM